MDAALARLREVVGSTNADESALRALLKAADSNVERAINYFFENGLPRLVPSVPPSTASAKPSPASIPRKSSTPKGQSAAISSKPTHTSVSKKPSGPVNTSKKSKSPAASVAKKSSISPRPSSLKTSPMPRQALLTNGTHMTEPAGERLFLCQRWVEVDSSCRGKALSWREEVFIKVGTAATSKKRSRDGKRRGADLDEETDAGSSAGLPMLSTARGFEGRLPLSLAYALGPLMLRGLLSVKAEVALAVPAVVHFSKVHLELKLEVSPKIFDLDETRDGITYAAAFSLLQWAHTGQLEEYRALNTQKDGGAASKEGATRRAPDDIPVAMDEDNIEPVEDGEVAKNVGVLLEKCDSTNLPEAPDPPLLHKGTRLRHYQRQALAWLLAREGKTAAEQELLEKEAEEREVLEESLLQSADVTCRTGVVEVHGLPSWEHPFWERRFLARRVKGGVGCHSAEAAEGVGEAPPVRLQNTVAYYVNTLSKRFQRCRPTGAINCKGGILSDAMGMGKTVMLLALILASKAREEGSDAAHTSLVVCPLSLIGQWREEITNRTEKGALKVLFHYGETKGTTTSSFSQYDVVLTTYGTLTSEFKTVEASGRVFDGPKATLTEAIRHGNGDKDIPKATGLFGRQWRRVILDEAHAIKNLGTEAAKGCMCLRANARWAVTGTPIQNSLSDLQSLIRFIRLEPWCDPAWWRRTIETPHAAGDPVALDRLQHILSDVLLRRTKSTKGKDGKPIVTLPPKTVEIVTLKMSSAEAEFYAALRERSRAEFYGYVSSGSALSSYIQILALLLRLRQCCDHPLLALGVPPKVPKSSVLSPEKKSEKDAEPPEVITAAPAFVQELYTKFASRILGTGNVANESNVGGGSSASNGSTSESQGGSMMYCDEVVNMLQAKGGLETQECPVCMDCPPCDPVLTPCGHLMCRECLLGCLEKESACPVCRLECLEEDIITVTDEEADVMVVEPTPTASNASAPKGGWVSSSKLDRLMAEVKSMRTNDKTTKAVIFSQWTSMLDIVGQALRLEKLDGVKFGRLDGSMSQKAREEALKKFSSEADFCILLVSLKAGGVGLNLTSASVVFLIDPWWNPAIELQAIDRCHRIGQEKLVTVKRFIVEDTVEVALLELQEKKSKLADQALDGAGRGEMSKLNLEDLKQLFR